MTQNGQEPPTGPPVEWWLSPVTDSTGRSVQLQVDKPALTLSRGPKGHLGIELTDVGYSRLAPAAPPPLTARAGQ
eukprot:1180409-Prorocentrum_minimum.AAC.1